MQPILVVTYELALTPEQREDVRTNVHTQVGDGYTVLVLPVGMSAAVLGGSPVVPEQAFYNINSAEGEAAISRFVGLNDAHAAPYGKA